MSVFYLSVIFNFVKLRYKNENKIIKSILGLFKYTLKYWLFLITKIGI